MTLHNEIEVYDQSLPNAEGEVEIFDSVIFQKIIRDREIKEIIAIIKKTNPGKILDYGCGGGWLSKILIKQGYHVTGIDSSYNLIKNAKLINNDPDSEFIVCDCENLPLRKQSFDFIIGVAILHHLNADHALKECNNVLCSKGYIVFLEPNALNPFMELGRRFFPSQIHTHDEKAIKFSKLQPVLHENGFEIIQFEYKFPFSFFISYAIKKMNVPFIDSITEVLYPFIKYSEILFEKIPLIKQIGGVLIFVGQKGL